MPDLKDGETARVQGSARETATILAALLYWREEMCPHGPQIMRPYFRAMGQPRAKPLSADEIKRLSKRLRASLSRRPS